MIPRPSLVLYPLLLALAGCGFQLRGDYHLPPAMERVVVTGSPLLRDELVAGLEASDIRVEDSRTEATATLALGVEQFSERVLSVDPDSGNAREYEVAYTVTFRVNATDGTVITPPQEVRLVRDYIYDPNAVIGVSREKSVLYEEMRRDAAQQILLRLQSLRGE